MNVKRVLTMTCKAHEFLSTDPLPEDFWVQFWHAPRLAAFIMGLIIACTATELLRLLEIRDGFSAGVLIHGCQYRLSDLEVSRCKIQETLWQGMKGCFGSSKKVQS